MILRASGMRKPEAGDADGFSDGETRLKPAQRLTASHAIVLVQADDVC